MKAKAKRALKTVGRTVKGTLPLPYHIILRRRSVTSRRLARPCARASLCNIPYHSTHRLTCPHLLTGVVSGAKHQTEDVVVAAAAAPSGAGEVGGGRPSGSPEEPEPELSPPEVRRIHAEFWRALRVVEARGRAARPVRARSTHSVLLSRRAGRDVLLMGLVFLFLQAEEASSDGSKSEEEGKEVAVGVPPPCVEGPRPGRPWALRRFLEEYS